MRSRFARSPEFWSDWPPPLLSSRALRRSVIVCKQCGTELPDHARFCLQCGSPVPPPEEQPPSPVPAGPPAELDFVQAAVAGGGVVGLFFTVPFIPGRQRLCGLWGFP